MTKIPKHQKGSQLKAIMQEKINSGFFNKKDAREAKKALQYIEDDLYYFKNSDGTYSVRQEQQGTTTTNTDGTTTTTDPQLEVTTNATGLHSNTGPLSLSRLGVGQGNKGSRKVANVMGYLMKSGDMTDYDSYRKSQEAKKAEEDKKNNPIKTEGTGATLNEDQSALTNAEQNTIISNQIASIKDSDIIYKSGSIEDVQAQYGLGETDPVPSFIKPTTNSDGETMYQIPTTSISAGGGAKETFVLDKSTGTWQVGSPLAGDASAIESYTPSKASFTGSSALDYQKFLAEQMKEKLMSGEVTEAQLSEKGINPNNLFNTNKNVSEYAKIISMTGDANSDQGQSTDGSGKTFSTGFDGLIGGATGKVEELLGITRPSNLQKAKTTRTTPLTDAEKAEIERKKKLKAEADALAAAQGSGSGSTLTASAQIMQMLEKGTQTLQNMSPQTTVPTKKKGGVSFSIVKKKYNDGGKTINLDREIKKLLLQGNGLKTELEAITSTATTQNASTTQYEKMLEPMIPKIKNWLDAIADLETRVVVEKEDKERTQEPINKARAGEDKASWLYDTQKGGKEVRSDYNRAVNNLKQNVIQETLPAFINKDYGTNLKLAKSEALATLDKIEKQADSFFSTLDYDTEVAPTETSGRRMIGDYPAGSPAGIADTLKTKAKFLKEKIDTATSVNDIKDYIRELEKVSFAIKDVYTTEGAIDPGLNWNTISKGGQRIIENTLGWIGLKDGGQLQTELTYRRLIEAGYTPEDIEALKEKWGTNNITPNNSQIINPTQTVATDNAGSPITDVADESGNSSLGELGVATVAGLGGLGVIKSAFNKKGWVRGGLKFGLSKIKSGAGNLFSGKTGEQLAEEAAKKKAKADKKLAEEAAEKAKQTNTSNTTTTTLTPEQKKVADLEDAIASQEKHIADAIATNKNAAEIKALQDLLETDKKKLTDYKSSLNTTTDTTSGSTLEKVTKTINSNSYNTKINRNSITGTLNARETLAARKKALLEKQSQFIQTNNQKQLERPLLEINRIKKDGGVIYEDGGNPQFTPIATDSDGNKFKASQTGKVYYDLGDGNWTEADSQEIYDYGKEIIQSQVKPQKTQEKETQVQEAQEPDQVDAFLNKNQWIPFVGAPTRRKEMDAFDYLTFAGGFVPVVGAGFEAVEAARNLYDEYQANDLDWQDVARNAGEIGVSFVGGKAIGGLGTMGKKAWKAMRKAEDGMKMEKPIINIKELGDNKIIGFKGFKLSKYKKGVKVSPKEESVLERVKTSKYDHLNKYINNL